MPSRLYCTNLPDKLCKHDLRSSLYTLFSTYGAVLDVVAMKTKKMRGQAHIVFKDVQASTQAMRALQGFDFFGKEMVRFTLGGLVKFALLTIFFRKLPMPKVPPTLSPGSGEHMLHLQLVLVRVASRQTFKSPSSAVLRALLRSARRQKLTEGCMV